MVNIQELTAGQSKAQLNKLADTIEKMADATPAKGGGAKAAAAKTATAKTAGVKTAGAKAAAMKATATKAGGSMAGKVATGVSAKSGAASSVAACTTKGLGLGLGLGSAGPVILLAGGAIACWYGYKKFFASEDNIDAPTI